MPRTRRVPALVRSASIIAFSAFFVSATIASAEDPAPAADPQAGAASGSSPGANQAAGDQQQSTEIVVSGVRASLERSMDLKRNSTGVVDGISAEDIGKFPDTNA